MSEVIYRFEAKTRDIAEQFYLVLRQYLFNNPSSIEIYDDVEYVSGVVEIQVVDGTVYDVISAVDDVRKMKVNLSAEEADLYNYLFTESRISVIMGESAGVGETTELANYLLENQQELGDVQTDFNIRLYVLERKLREQQTKIVELEEQYKAIQVYLHEVAKIPELKLVVGRILEETCNEDILLEIVKEPTLQ